MAEPPAQDRSLQCCCSLVLVCLVIVAAQLLISMTGCIVCLSNKFGICLPFNFCGWFCLRLEVKNWLPLSSGKLSHRLPHSFATEPSAYHLCLAGDFMYKSAFCSRMSVQSCWGCWRQSPKSFGFPHHKWVALHRLLFWLGEKSAQDAVLMHTLISWHVLIMSPSVRALCPSHWWSANTTAPDIKRINATHWLCFIRAMGFYKLHNFYL